MPELRLFEDEEIWVEFLELAPQSKTLTENLQLAKIFGTDRERTLFFIIKHLVQENKRLQPNK